MAAVTYDYESTQLEQIRQRTHNPLAPIDSGARVRIKRFKYTATGDEVADEVIELLGIPANTDIITGRVVWDGTFGATNATLDIGHTAHRTPVDDDEDSLLDGEVITSAGSAELLEGAVPLRITVPSVLFATVKVAGLGAGGVAEGWIMYAEN